MSDTIVFIASDHRGFQLKAQFIDWMKDHGFTAKDLGTDSEARCDALDFARKMALEFKTDTHARGILICGSGQAMAMTANRYKNLRAALCTDTTMTRLAREHNDANILALGADIIGEAVALDCLEVFLKTKSLGGRYAERRERLTGLGGL
jgi:ribose 5-phosphate isomerase B